MMLSYEKINNHYEIYEAKPEDTGGAKRLIAIVYDEEYAMSFCDLKNAHKTIHDFCKFMNE